MLLGVPTATPHPLASSMLGAADAVDGTAAHSAGGMRKARARVVIVDTKEESHEALLASESTNDALPSPLSATPQSSSPSSQLPTPLPLPSGGGPTLFGSVVQRAVKVDNVAAAIKAIVGRKPLVQDRSILDQRLFYRTIRPQHIPSSSSLDAQLSPTSAPLTLQHAPPPMQAAPNTADSGLDAAGVSDVRWASTFSHVEGRTYMDLATVLGKFGDVTFALPSGLEPSSGPQHHRGSSGMGSTAASFYTHNSDVKDTVHPVNVPDSTCLLYIRSLRDMYRSGVRYKRRNGLSRRNWRGGTSSLTESMITVPPPVRAASVSSATSAASTSTANAVLRMKIRTVETELLMMQQAKRNASVGDQPYAIFASEGGADVVSSLTTSVSSATASPQRRDRIDSLTFSGRRKSALELILQPRLSLAQQKRHANGASQKNNIADDSEGEESEEDTRAEALMDRQLVDRFTGASLEAMMAVSRRLLQQPQTRLQSIRVLTLCGAGIGDDGCFILLQALRFGPLKGVQCLDLMYNQLTTKSAFYMGIFLLLRPPISLVEADINGSLRSEYEEAGVTVDARQQALSLIAAKRAAQRGGGGGGASNRQGPLFFLPLYDSWKSLMQEFFSKRKVMAGINGGPASAPPSRLSSLRNVVHATLSFSALKSNKSNQNLHAHDDASITLRSPMLVSSQSLFSSSTAAIVDEDAFVGESGSDDGDHSDEHQDSGDEGFEDHLQELQALLMPPPAGSRASSVSGPTPRGSVADAAGVNPLGPTNQQWARMLKGLQDNEISNAATELISLRLAWNDLQDEGIRMLSEWLSVQTFLLELNVAHNDATDIGFSALRDALRSTTSLISLNTEGNAMEDATAEVMRGALLYNRRLHAKVHEPADTNSAGDK